MKRDTLMQNGRFGGIGLSAKKFEIDMSTGFFGKKYHSVCHTVDAFKYSAASLQCGGYYCRGTICGEGGTGGGRSTGPLINLLTNLFIGLSVGTSVLISTCYGANDRDGVEKGVHTSIVLSIIGGRGVPACRHLLCAAALLMMGLAGGRH